MATDADILAIATPQVARDEGCRLNAYPDPLSGGAPWTIGYGATGPGIGPGTVWSQQTADIDLAARMGALCSVLDDTVSWWRGLDAVRAAVLVNMAYNLGLNGLLGFPHALSCMQSGDWSGASAQMLSSTWAHQVPSRASRLAKQMLTGIAQ